MITIISGTNRPSNITRKVAAGIEAIYQTVAVKTRLLDLAKLPPEFFLPDAYAEKPAAFKKILRRLSRRRWLGGRNARI